MAALAGLVKLMERSYCSEDCHFRQDSETPIAYLPKIFVLLNAPTLVLATRCTLNPSDDLLLMQTQIDMIDGCNYSQNLVATIPSEQIIF